jgi:hypothetical protein
MNELEQLRHENARLKQLLEEAAEVLRLWPDPEADDEATKKARYFYQKLMGLE